MCIMVHCSLAFAQACILLCNNKTHSHTHTSTRTQLQPNANSILIFTDLIQSLHSSYIYFCCCCCCRCCCFSHCKSKIWNELIICLFRRCLFLLRLILRFEQFQVHSSITSATSTATASKQTNKQCQHKLLVCSSRKEGNQGAKCN